MPDDVRAAIEIETDNAESNVEGLEAKVKDLDKAVDNVDGSKVDVPVDAPGAVDAADHLDKVDAAARRAGTGSRVGVQGIADLAGPMGDASSQASTMGQSVEGMASIVEGLAGRMGASEEMIGKLGGALGGIGVAVALGAAAWSIFSKNAEAAAKEAEKMKTIQESFAKGDFSKAADDLAESYGTLYDRAMKIAGIPAGDITGAIAGDPDAIERVNTAMAAYVTSFDTVRGRNAAGGDVAALTTDLDKAATAWQTNADNMEHVTSITGPAAEALSHIAEKAGDAHASVSDLADDFDHLNKALDIQSSALDVEQAFDDLREAARKANEAQKTGGQESVQAQRDLQQSVIATKQEVIGYADKVGSLPADQVTNIIADIDDGSIANAQATFDELKVPITKTVIITTLHDDDTREAHRANTAGNGTTNVTNVYQPPITPLAVQAAQQKTDQIQRASNFS